MLPYADASRPPYLADFELLKLIGRGSYGDVWLARGVTGVFRAVKIVWRDRFPDPRPYLREFEGVTRFASISLREPSQLALLHAGRSENDGFFYYVMELADDVSFGRTIDPVTYQPLTLKELRVRHGYLPPDEVVALGSALARALASLHSAGLVHRDIKPSNIVMIGGVPKLADVGLVAAASAGLTFVGTEGYVPPEGPGAPAADVYSLGKVLYELATGLDRNDWPRLPPDLATRSSRQALLELNEVLLRACETDAKQRFHDASALLDELLLLQAGKSVRRLRHAERRFHRAMRMASVLAVTSAIAGAGAWIEHRRAAAEVSRRQAVEVERESLRQRVVYTARLAQVRRALDQHDFRRARRELIEAAPTAGAPDLRGPEWHALSHLSRGTPGRVLRSKGAHVGLIAVAPGAPIVAVHDESSRVVLYEVPSGRELLTVPQVKGLAGFSTDGTWLVGSDLDSSLQRWRTDTGGRDPEMVPLPPHRPLHALGADGVLAWQNAAENGTSPPTLVVWNFAERRTVASLPMGNVGDNPPWVYYRSAFDSVTQEAVIVTGRGRGTTQQYRLSHVRLNPATISHELLADFLPTAIGSLLVHPGQKVWWAAEGISGRQLHRGMHQTSWMPVAELVPLGLNARLAWNTAQGPLWVYAHHSRISLVNPTRPEAPIGEIRGHSAPVTALANLGIDHLVTASAAGEVRLWNLSTVLAADAPLQCWNSRGAATQVLFEAGGAALYAPRDGRSVDLLDRATLEPRYRIEGVRRTIGLTPRHVWGISADGHALVRWPRDAAGPLEEFARAPSAIANATVPTSGAVVAFTRSSGELGAFRPDQPQEVQLVPGGHQYLWALQLSERGDRLWTVGHHWRVECRSIPDGNVLWSKPVPAMPTSLCFVPNSPWVVVAVENGDLLFHNAETGHLERTVPSGSSATQAIAATQDGRRLLAAGIEGDIHWIDTRTGDYLVSIPVRSADTVHTIALSPDELHLATLGKSGLLRVLPVGPTEVAFPP